MNCDTEYSRNQLHLVWVLTHHTLQEAKLRTLSVIIVLYISRLIGASEWVFSSESIYTSSKCSSLALRLSLRHRKSLDQALIITNSPPNNHSSNILRALSIDTSLFEMECILKNMKNKSHLSEIIYESYLHTNFFDDTGISAHKRIC